MLQVVTGERGPLVVLLHGFAGTPEDLEPFARSMGVQGRFVFPEGLADLRSFGLLGRGWWSSDGSGRDAALRSGIARDLSDLEPEGLQPAHDALCDLLASVRAESEHSPLVLGGFSQGAMLAFDVVLRSQIPVGGVVQLSGARIASRLWNPRLHERVGTKAFIAHGRLDPDLAFNATERFERDLRGAGWLVDFCPFDGAHEVPLVVLRGLRRFLLEM